MAYLSLTEDELALLRFTCDLFFVEESPLHYLEASAREPQDFERSYRSLIEKKVIDPTAFRITDDALNRLAPITECDGRVIHVKHLADGTTEQTDYWVLDEIGVELVQGETGLAVGVDLDPEELVERIARRLVPRKSAGDVFSLQLDARAFLAFCAWLEVAREDPSLRVSQAQTRARLASTHLVGAPPNPQATLLSPLHVRQLLTSDGAKEKDDRASAPMPLLDCLEPLLAAGVLIEDGDAYIPRPALHALLEGLPRGQRHGLIRFDFGEDDWLVRETLFYMTDGGLFCVRVNSDGTVVLDEVDGAGLRSQLLSALGPLTPAPPDAPKRRLRDLFLGDEGFAPPSKPG